MKKIGGRCPRCGWRDKRIFRKTAIKTSKKNLVPRAGGYN